MTDEMIELGHRAVACKGWRWMSGMAWVIPSEARGTWPEHLHHGRYPTPEGLVPLPDLRDPATLGCLLALVREAWGKPLLYVEPEEDEIDGLAWYVWDAGEAQSYSRGLHRTEAAALVAALEAAMEKVND
jgi:hypothetical protein